MLGWVVIVAVSALVTGTLGFAVLGGIVADALKLMFLLLLALLVIGAVSRFMPRQNMEDDLPDGDGQGAA
jgi:uncharacterized membrane protein YtjA (UPF0391 family)